MGIFASIAATTTIAVINRQRRNATINTLNNIYGTAKEMLYLVQNSSYDEHITVNDNKTFCYISLITMLDSGIIDGDDYRPQSDDIYFCFNMNETWAVITNASFDSTKPTTTGTVEVNKTNITFNFSSDKFISA